MSLSRCLRVLLPIAAAAATFVLVFPRVTGTSWDATFDVFGTIPPQDIALLSVVWFAGLCCYTSVMRASLPDLTIPQALTLNLGGSAVSNLLPFGGAVGMGLNFAMARSWGFRRSSFVAFTALTTAANIAAKLVLPVLAVLLISSSGAAHDRALDVTAIASGGVAAIAALLVVLSATPNPLARSLLRLERRVGRVVLDRFSASPALARLRDHVVRSIEETRGVARRAWRRIGLGMAGYSALQALLMWLVLGMVHSDLGLPAILAGFALERALTLAVITPGGVGIAQTGAAAVLIALGGSPVNVAAGVVLYSAFTFFLEIPVGGAVALGWWLSQRSPRATSRAGRAT